LGFGGLFTFFFALIIFQLADKDNRNGWLWGGSNLTASIALSNISGLGGIAVYLVFLATIIALIYTKPIKRM
jgi:hypothetical protein